ncbi:hypothetical protein [Telmatospirillum sp. J64-1]|nr:hypothetical protein [Telmatospirillum sp. J64-1]
MAEMPENEKPSPDSHRPYSRKEGLLFWVLFLGGGAVVLWLFFR